MHEMGKRVEGGLFSAAGRSVGAGEGILSQKKGKKGGGEIKLERGGGGLFSAIISLKKRYF